MRNQIKVLIGMAVFFGLSAGAVAGLLFFINANPETELNFLTAKSASTVEIDKALQAAIRRHPEVLAYTLYNVSVDHVDFSADKKMALAWLALTDKQTGDPVPSEPGLAIVVQTSAKDSPAPVWQAIVQADKNWNDQMALVPDDLLNAEGRAQFTAPDQPITKAPPFTGYRLPWAKGQTKILTGSIGHVFTYKSCPSTCLYAFDFADGTMFPVMAAKGGVVKQAVWNYANGNTTNANYLLIEDSSTSPVSYMIYMHFAQNSIPAELRVPGAVVTQGQFIGNADDTGYSTGHHLHFHVHTNPTSYFGTSVDIVFEDVPVNGGRPRTCTEAQNYPSYGGQCQTNDAYTSGNGDSQPPYGGLSLPQAGQTIKSASITIAGWGKDDVAVTRLQPVVNYDGIWRPVGASVTGAAINTEVNLCEAGVPDGPVSVGLMVYDRAGNQSVQAQGQRVLTKQFTCDPQPAVCKPGADQAAIFVNRDYQGPCQILEIGNYSDLSVYPAFGDNNLEAIMVGANVTAAVFDGLSYKDRVESFGADDPDLSDNLLGLDRASSIRVLKNPITPAAPQLTPPASAANKSPTSLDSLTLSWLPGLGALEYRSELTGPSGFSKSRDWSRLDSWSVGSLPAGKFTWTVWGRNGDKESQASLSFSVTEASLSQSSPLPVPYSADFESAAAGWTSSGLWKKGRLTWGELATNAWYTGDTTSYASSDSLTSDLTSPPIQVPYEGLSMQFSYFTETESLSAFRDQRWVQISQDGGSFANVLQIQDVQTDNPWVENKTIDLTPYSGHAIRVRFHFAPLDAFYNDHFGWAVDNIRIDADAAKLCGEQPSDETPQTASLVELPAKTDGILCPEGDVDFYKLTAVKEQRFTALVAADGWQPALSFLSSDGKTVLAELSAADESALHGLTFTAPDDGLYYLKISAFSGTENQQVKAYKLRLLNDQDAPQITVKAPTADAPLQAVPFTIALDVDDGDGSGVASVEFWWHTKSWANDKWELLGTDTDGSDGWNFEIPAGYAEPIAGAALFLRAGDYAENYRGVTIPVNPVDAAPASHLLILPETSASTAVLLTWKVDANPDSIQKFLLQYRAGEGDWKNYGAALDSAARQTWFVGKNNVTYQFRLTAVDVTGREETWPDEAETSIKIESACTPDAFEKTDLAEGQPEPAVAVELNQLSPEHNFCGLGDQDWFQFSAEKDKTYQITAAPVAGGAAPVVQVYSTDRSAVLQEAAAANLDSSAGLQWKAPADGDYLIRVSALKPAVAGTGATYTLKVEKSGAFSFVGLACSASLIPALLYGLKVIIDWFRKQAS